jgi:hypothetical protein
MRKLPLLLFAALSLSSCEHVVDYIKFKRALDKEQAGSPEATPVTTAAHEKEEPARDGLVVKYRSDGTLGNETNFKNGVKHGLAKNYSKDGKKLLSEVMHVDGRITGIARNYYPSGKVSNEMSYLNDTLHGDSKWFYEDGKLYQLTPYSKGLMEGTKITYNKSGKIVSEVPYHKDEVALGTKEYTADGSLKKMPEIVIEPIDRRLIDGTYVLKVSMSDRNPKARFFTGKLDQGKYLGNDITWYPGQGGVVEIRYDLPPGTFVMEKINLIATSFTKVGNPVIVQKSYNVAVENK